MYIKLGILLALKTESDSFFVSNLATKIVLILAPSPIFSLISCFPKGVLYEFSSSPSPYFEVETGKLSFTLPLSIINSLCSEISTTISSSFELKNTE